MKAIYFILCILVCFSSVCRVVGDRSMIMVTPEEKIMIEQSRKSKQKTRVVNKIKNRVFPDLILEPQREKSWGFKWAWDRGISAPGKPSKENPDYDDDGNLIVSPEVVNTYKIPDLHSGFGYDFKADKFRAFLEMEVCEFKVPKFRYLPVGFLAAEQFVGVHLSKRWSSIFEIESGVFVGKDFETNETTWGISALVIKF